jgi:hypothetical protein
MTHRASAVWLTMGLSLFLAGCEGVEEPPRIIPPKADFVEGRISGIGDVFVAVGLTVASDIKSARHVRAMRPRFAIRAPDGARVNESVRLEVAYREQGKVLADCWTHSPYTITIRRESDGCEVKPESEERRVDGKLIVTFRGSEPDYYVVEVKIWAVSADPATARPKAAAKRTISVQ